MNMRKKFLGLIVLGLIVALSISACGKKSVQISEQAEKDDVPRGEYSINDLLTMNKPMKCKWQESLTEGGEVTNEIYIDGRKFYQAVKMDEIGNFYSLSDGEYIYFWNDYSAVASKMKIDELESKAEPKGETESQNVDLDKRLDFVCERWTLDKSVFDLPAGKDFKDVTQEIGEMMEELQINTDEICDMCLSAPTAELQAECLRNAGCE